MTSRSLTSSTTMSDASLSDAASAAAMASEMARSDAVTSGSRVIVATEDDDDVGDGLADRAESYVGLGQAECTGNGDALGSRRLGVREDEHRGGPVPERVVVDVLAVLVGEAGSDELGASRLAEQRRTDAVLHEHGSAGSLQTRRNGVGEAPLDECGVRRMVEAVGRRAATRVDGLHLKTAVVDITRLVGARRARDEVRQRC